MAVRLPRPHIGSTNPSGNVTLKARAKLPNNRFAWGKVAPEGHPI